MEDDGREDSELELPCFLATPSEQRKARFPNKLWDAISEDTGLISWSTDGCAITVDEEQFEEEVLDKLPGLVQIACFANFRRQLREYGFDWWEQNGTQNLHFQHPCFQRDRKDLLPGVMTRRKSRFGGHEGESPDSEPEPTPFRTKENKSEVVSNNCVQRVENVGVMNQVAPPMDKDDEHNIPSPTTPLSRMQHKEAGLASFEQTQRRPYSGISGHPGFMYPVPFPEVCHMPTSLPPPRLLSWSAGPPVAPAPCYLADSPELGCQEWYTHCLPWMPRQSGHLAKLPTGLLTQHLGGGDCPSRSEPYPIGMFTRVCRESGQYALAGCPLAYPMLGTLDQWHPEEVPTYYAL